MSIDWSNPEEVLKAYDEGLKTATFDPIDMMLLLEQLKTPFFSEVGDQLFATGKGMLSLPYKAIQHFYPNFGTDENQTTGDCVSHSTRNAIDVTRCYEILYKKEKEVFVARAATEPIYGFRGHGGQGMHCSQAARFVAVDGGVLLREKYPDIGVDLSKYDAKIGINWGSRGVPEKVMQKAKEHQIVATTVGTIEQARDLLANGYALSVCSNYGFSNVRDKNGISETNGTWGHAMAWIGCDDTKERANETLFLVPNSWGKWNSGPRVHGQPEGSFWIRQKVAEAMIGYGAAFAFSNFKGFQRKMNWDRIKGIYS
jgi:hypothetical protein